MRDYLAAWPPVDESVGQVLDYLDRHHLARNTVVIYTSDQDSTSVKTFGSINGLPTMCQ